MAFDKVIDSVQLDNDIKSVADAIRAKGGTTAQLTFPTGFNTAIENIKAGGGALAPDDTIGWYKTLRASNAPKVDLPSEMPNEYGCQILFRINKENPKFDDTRIQLFIHCNNGGVPGKDFGLIEKKYLDKELVSEKEILAFTQSSQEWDYTHQYKEDTEDFNFILFELKILNGSHPWGTIACRPGSMSPYEASVKNVSQHKYFCCELSNDSDLHFFSLKTNVAEMCEFPTLCKNLLVIPELDIVGVHPYAITQNLGWPSELANLISMPPIDLGDYEKPGQPVPFKLCPNLMYIPFTTINNFTVPNTTYLTRDEVLRWFNAMPSVSTKQTIKFADYYNVKKYITSKDIEIMTNKGWTVSV